MFYAIFLDMTLICSLHVRCLSMLTPTNLVDDTWIYIDYQY